MFKSVAFLLAIGLFSAISARDVDYSGHMVIRVVPKTNEQLKFLARLQSTTSTDFWAMPGKINAGSADIHVSPESYHHIAKSLAENGIDHSIWISDIGKLERNEQAAIALREAVFSNSNKADHEIDFENYNNYTTIMEYLDDLVLDHPDIVTKKVSTNLTSEGREIVQVTITNLAGASNKPVIFFDCNIHAREWISPATCLWIIEELVHEYGIDPEITDLVNRYAWKFIPVLNPDGYVYTWTNDRLWRKNRVANVGSTCAGVDINRNFAAGFGNQNGASRDPCEETFCGSSALSEREARALREFVEGDRGRIKTALSIHSYSQVWLSPYGYQTALPANYTEMERVMRVGVGALTATYGTRYSFGSTSAVLYIASGTTTDYYYENQGIFHSYTIELRDTGVNGFLLPPDQIIPTAIETWNGIKAFINAI